LKGSQGFFPKKEIMMLNTHSALRQVGRLYLAVGMGAMLLLLAGCAGSDQPVSNDDVQTPAAQGAITQ
jgi:hypothetical protein